MPSESVIKKNLLRAKAASKMSDNKIHKLGAVMVMGNKVLAVGYNTTKTHPLQKEYNKVRGYDPEMPNNGQIHAEMMCLLNTQYIDVNWAKVSVYIYREHKDHSVAMAKPCPACQKALKERGIIAKNIYYTTNNVPYSKLEKGSDT